MGFNLADMLKDVSDSDTGREQIEYISLGKIDSDANNFYQLSEIEGLADNIALCGLQQPIRVRRNPENPERYTIVSGHRRRAAIEMLAKDDPEKWQEAACIIEREAKRQQPYVDMARLVYERVGIARAENRVSIEKLFKAQKRFYNSGVDDKRQQDYERGKGTFTDNTDLPFGYSVRASLLITIRDVADALGCSVDYLLGRTDDLNPKLVSASNSDTEEKEPMFIPGAWYAASVEPPVGEKLILMDSGGYVDTGKYKGCGEYDMDYGDPVVLWTPMPEERDIVTSVPVFRVWNTGDPKAYGNYVAYIRLHSASAPVLRELLWDGEEWFLYGEKIHADVTVQCWAERPII